MLLKTNKPYYVNTAIYTYLHNYSQSHYLVEPHIQAHTSIDKYLEMVYWLKDTVTSMLNIPFHFVPSLKTLSTLKCSFPTNIF